MAGRNHDRDAADKEWRELVDKVLHIEPNTILYNTQVRYRSHSVNKDDSSLELCFSYPCRGIYDFSDYFPHVCHVCAEHGKESIHGRAFLNGEDGLLLLPHIIYSQADAKQLVTDLSKMEHLYFSAGENSEDWFGGLKELVDTDPFFKTLPVGDPSKTKPFDLNKEKTVWVFC